MKIVVFRYDAVRGPFLLFWYDECRRPEGTPPRRIDD